MSTGLHGAPHSRKQATDTHVCVCPCRFAGHEAVCRIAIRPGEMFYVALVGGTHHRQVMVCSPCWDAIQGRQAAEG